MADPIDPYQELTPSGQPAPAVDNLGVAAGTPGFDPNSTANDLVRAADDAARAARIASPSANQVVVAPNSAADEWNASFLPGGEHYSLTPSQWNDLNPAMPVNIRGRGRHGGFNNIDQAYEAAHNYHADTAEAVAKISDARKRTDSADFVQKLGALDHADPNYSQKFADIVATHPYAGGDLVDAVIKEKQGVRSTYQKALENGGASAFGSKDNPTPAYNSYVSTFGKTKDPDQARAAAELTQKNESLLDDAAKKGLLTPADIPPWNDAWHTSSGDSGRPKVWNRDATLNYGELKKIIAQREGAGQSLADQRKQVSEDRLLISTLGPQLQKMEDDDPNKAVIQGQYQEAVDRLQAHSSELNSKNPKPNTPPTISDLLPPPRKKK